MQKRMEALDKFINAVDFDQLWDGFSKTKYALYNEKNFCLDGKIEETDERFMGNTAIKIDSENIYLTLKKWNG